MRVENHSLLTSILASSTDLKESELHTVLSGILEQIKPLQLAGQGSQALEFESNFKPLPVIWKSLPIAIPEDNRRFSKQNQGSSSLGIAHCSGTALAGRTD